MIIDHPTPDLEASLRQLWKDTFADSDAFLDAFFSTAYDPRRCLCATGDGALLAAVYWFDCTAADEKLAYLYALAVDASRRGRGMGSALMEQVHTLLTARHYQGVLLVPQEEHLIRMYRRMGYSHDIPLAALTCACGSEAVPLRQLSGFEYARLRRQYLPQGAVVQEGENLTFLQTQADFYAGEDFLLAARREQDRLFGPELLGNASAAPGILKTLGCQTGTFRIPGTDSPFAMYRPLTPTPRKIPTHFAFAFD